MVILNNRNSSENGHLKNGYRKPTRYSAFDLLRHGFSQADWPRAWRKHDLRPSYDVVVVGGGVHGLATAYYLAAKHGITAAIQPGGSVRDSDVIAAANRLGLAMVFTGIRHFRH